MFNYLMLNISKEVKIGFVGLLLVFSVLFVFNFLKQNNYFSTNMLITAKFSNIEFLKKGSLVLMKGRPIGFVVAVYKTEEGLFVDLDIEGDTKIPLDATALIAELSLMGGRTVSINFEKECQQNCLESGAVIPGTVYTMKEQVEESVGPILQKVGQAIDSLTGSSGIDAMLQSAQESARGLAQTTEDLNLKMRQMSRSLPSSISRFRSVTAGMLSADQLKNKVQDALSNQQALAAFDTIVQNISSLTQEDIEAMTKMLYAAAEQLDKLPGYLVSSNKMLAKADTLLTGFKAKTAAFQVGSKGMPAKLLYQKEFKDSLNSSILKVSESLLGIRNQPQNYLSLKKKK
jgi:phospholipid/cholesterol/gamma-HCH transport system substrate-binding protein